MIESGEGMPEASRWRARLWATVNAVLREPGFLTEEFLAGRRAQWLTPFGICMICATAYFGVGAAVSRIASEPVVVSEQLPFPPEAQEALQQMGARERLGDERFTRMVSDARALSLRLGKDIGDAVSLVMLILMPMFAALTWLAWRGVLGSYADHLVFAMHVHASLFASMAMAEVLSLVGSQTIAVLAGVGVLVYSTWYCAAAFKRVLGGTGAQLFVRSMLVGITYGIWLTAALLSTAAYALLTY